MSSNLDLIDTIDPRKITTTIKREGISLNVGEAFANAQKALELIKDSRNADALSEAERLMRAVKKAGKLSLKGLDENVANAILFAREVQRNVATTLIDARKIGFIYPSDDDEDEG